MFLVFICVLLCRTFIKNSKKNICFKKNYFNNIDLESWVTLDLLVEVLLFFFELDFLLPSSLYLILLFLILFETNDTREFFEFELQKLVFSEQTPIVFLFIFNLFSIPSKLERLGSFSIKILFPITLLFQKLFDPFFFKILRFFV